MMIRGESCGAAIDGRVGSAELDHVPRDNKLGAEGAKALAGALGKMTGLQTLDLR